MKIFFLSVVLMQSLIAGSDSARGMLLKEAIDDPAHTAFDVISIRTSDPKNTGFAIRPKPSNFSIRGASIKFLIGYAYHLHDSQITGIPTWARSARFDIDAKMDDTTSDPPSDTNNPAQSEKILEERLRTMLAERFHLLAHESKVEAAVYRLELTKGAVKLKRSDTNTGYTSSSGYLICSDSSMDTLASMLSDELNAIVTNATGLSGGYAFSLKWTPAYLQSVDSTDPGIFTALKDQLGLKLVSSRGEVTALSVDEIKRPSEN